MGRPVKPLAVTLEERLELRNRVRAATTPQRDSLRARIILQRARGEKVQDVARQLGVSVACVSKWSSRFEREGLAGLKDAAGRGRKPWLPKEKILFTGDACVNGPFNYTGDSNTESWIGVLTELQKLDVLGAFAGNAAGGSGAPQKSSSPALPASTESTRSA